MLVLIFEGTVFYVFERVPILCMSITEALPVFSVVGSSYRLTVVLVPGTLPPLLPNIIDYPPAMYCHLRIASMSRSRVLSRQAATNDNTDGSRMPNHPSVCPGDPAWSAYTTDSPTLGES